MSVPGTRREHEVGAVGRDHRLPLAAHALGHHDHAAVALDRGDRGARDAGVAGRALDDRHAGPQVAPRLGLREHRSVDAVLHRAGRPVPLHLREHLDAGRRDPLQPDERGPSDRVEQRRDLATVGIPRDRHLRSSFPHGHPARAPRSTYPSRLETASAASAASLPRGRSTARIRNAGPETLSAATT